MKKINRNLIYPLVLMGFVLFIISSCKKDENNSPSNPTVTDHDGNVYHTVNVNTQSWMVENLKTITYNDGSPITLVEDTTDWAGRTTEAYCWYKNDEATNKNTYGALYNFYAVNTGKLCPAGWHVPSQNEWEMLITNLGGDSLAGGKLKESGTDHWVSPNTGADNSSGFTALPGGSRYSNGGFYLNGKYGWYMSKTESDANNSWHVYMQYNTQAIVGKAGSKKDGFSVRCIKDDQ
jgi:uncharacterized protein (TIGR02145 family)